MQMASQQKQQQIQQELQQQLLDALSAAGFSEVINQPGSLEQRLKAVLSLPYRHLVIVDGVWGGAAGWKLLEGLGLHSMEGTLLLTARISVDSPLWRVDSNSSCSSFSDEPRSANIAITNTMYLQPKHTEDCAAQLLNNKLKLSQPGTEARLQVSGAHALLEITVWYALQLEHKHDAVQQVVNRMRI
jgi:hypothetical protein